MLMEGSPQLPYHEAVAFIKPDCRCQKGEYFLSRSSHNSPETWSKTMAQEQFRKYGCMEDLN